MYKIDIILHRDSKTVIVKKTIEDIEFTIKKQIKKHEKIDLKGIQKKLDEEINREFLLS